jgi:hypothetical protein
MSTTNSTITVGTDNPYGYRLFVSMPSNRSLVHGSSGDSITPVDGTPDKVAASLPINGWGLSVIASDGYWISPSTDPLSTILVNQTTGPTNQQTEYFNTTVYYGVRVDRTLTSGKYEGEIVYSVVVN